MTSGTSMAGVPCSKSLLPAARHRLRATTAGEDGMVSAFVLAMTLALLALAGLCLDGGLALAAKARALGQAEEAARAGAQQIDLSTYRTTGALRLQPQQAQAAAQRFLTAEHATGTVTVAGNTVTVVVTATQRTQLLGLVGLGALSVTATGKAVPRRGIDGAGG